jgi:hypothetical protein
METLGSENIFTNVVYRVLQYRIGCYAKWALPERAAFSPRAGIFFPILDTGGPEGGEGG